MRNYILVLACLSLFACAFAKNLILGKRLQGDVLLQNQSIYKPDLPDVSRTAIIDARAPAEKIISYVNITSIDSGAVQIELIDGRIGTQTVIVQAVGEQSCPLKIQALIYGVPHNYNTTPAPTTTVPSTIKDITETTTPESTETTSPESTETSTPASSRTTTPESSGTTTPDSSGTTTPDSSGTTTPDSSETTTPESTETTTESNNASPTSKVIGRVMKGVLIAGCVYSVFLNKY
ncbi:cell wall protein RTB1-like [Ceratina calcarata]|uniref:Cell wall protein RTB1-like n=1 Tax=Ceratina calcarata TaxID=156304 RepID=A0AAJ7RYK6_9HYME|nr:cell wall protein RTB1-like [Ceratina calcarata]